MPSVPNQSRHFFSQLLESAQQKNLRRGRALHGRIIKSARSSCAHLGNALVSLYAKCGEFGRAKLVLNTLARKDVVTWNSLINACSQMGASGSSMAMELLREMRRENASPNSHSLSGILVAASNTLDAWHGREAHAVVVKTVGFGDVFVGSSLLNLYCKAGPVSDARKVFDEMPDRNLVSWATMISGYGRERMAREALVLFRLMREEEQEFSSEFIFTGVLSAMVAPETLDAGRQIHCLAVKNGLLGFVAVGNSLVTMYAKCQSLSDAFRMFELSNDKNSITWSAMVTGLAQSGDSREALNLLSTMHSSGITPSEFTLVGVISACSDIAAIEEGKQLHGFSIKLGLERHVYTMAALVDMYAKCGIVDDALIGFDSLPDPDLVLWSSMIGGFISNGDNESALSLYCRMQMQGIAPNELTMASVLKACSNLAALEQGRQIHGHTIKHGFGLEIPIGSALSTMYAKSGSLEEGESVFRRMRDRDVISYNAMISGLSNNGQGGEALGLFSEMLSEGTNPDLTTFVNVLSSCSHAGLVDEARKYFKLMAEFGLSPRVEHYACMVDALSRAGKLREAKELIQSATIEHGSCLWRILLGACRNHGDHEIGVYAGEKLVELGSRDSSAYVVLSGIYASLGMKNEVERIRKTMKSRGVSKEPGCSWIELRRGVHVFVAGDESHPRIGDVRLQIRRLSEHMDDEEYTKILESASA